MSILVHSAAAAAILSQSIAIGMLPRITASSTLKTVPEEWLSRPATYNSKWPFQPGMRVRTKGCNGYERELVLDHATQTFHYKGLSGSTPTEILTKMALSGYMPLSTARSNWSSIWVTDDIGLVNVLGKDFRRAFSLHNGHNLKKTMRLDVPPQNTNSKWPFTPDMRVFTKGWKGAEHELTLDHTTQTFHCKGLSGATPTEILTNMALAGHMSLSEAFQNWSYIWVTRNNDTILGKTLRWAFSVESGYDMLERERLDVPSVF